MTAMQGILQRIFDAGIVGAGGAGFPTHEKLSARAGTIIANGAECEPVLRTDILAMERFPGEVVDGLLIAMGVTGAERGVIAIKKKHPEAIAAVGNEISGSGIELLALDSFYPAGDEQMLVYEATKRIVPTGGLPVHVGAIVQNTGTLINISRAARGIPLTRKLVTVGGLAKPMVFDAPVGAPLSALLEAAGVTDFDGMKAVIGGPFMGRVTDDFSEPVTKTTGGVLLLPEGHPLILKKTAHSENELRMIQSVCCQCNMCTQLCPRNALGLKVEPHKVMRAVAYGRYDGIVSGNGIFSCCDCGVCTYYACNFSLSPSKMMQKAKAALSEAGVKPVPQALLQANENFEEIKIPTARLLARLMLTEYEREIHDITPLQTDRVAIPLKMHIGAPARPLVKSGSEVRAGQLIAAPEGLGANIHASISGKATVYENRIEIDGGAL